MSANTIRPIQVEIFIDLKDLEEILKNVESIKENHPDIVVTIRAQKKEKYLREVEKKPEEQTLAASSSDKSLDKFKCLKNFEDETVLHYCTKQEMAEIAGKYGGLDWLVGAEGDIKNLTADMAGFKSKKSQRVIIDYDKGYGKFLVRRFDMDYGVQEVIDVAMFENWVSVNLPENCPNICISFKREIAEMQIKKFGAKPLYGFDKKKEDWLPIEVFITYGGWLAPEQRHPEVVEELCTTSVTKETLVDKEKQKWLNTIGAKEFPEAIKYTYTFPKYNGAFNLSEKYIKETSLEDLRAQYQENKIYVEKIIQQRKIQDNFVQGVERL